MIFDWLRQVILVKLDLVQEYSSTVRFAVSIDMHIFLFFYQLDGFAKIWKLFLSHFL